MHARVVIDGAEQPPGEAAAEIARAAQRAALFAMVDTVAFRLAPAIATGSTVEVIEAVRAGATHLEDVAQYGLGNAGAGRATLIGRLERDRTPIDSAAAYYAQLLMLSVRGEAEDEATAPAMARLYHAWATRMKTDLDRVRDANGLPIP